MDGIPLRPEGDTILYSWIMSFRVSASRRFFIVTSMVPFVVGMILTFVNGNIGVGVAFGGAFSLVRFRSAQGSSEEIAILPWPTEQAKL